MRYSAILYLSALVVGCLFPLSPTHAQFPNISDAVAGDNEATFSISKLPNLDAIYDTSFADEKPYPYWQAFWVFGDGNYYYQVGEMLPENSIYQATNPGTIYSENYKYLLENNLEYTPIVLMIDRKTDNPPPPAARPIPLYDPSISGSNPLKTISGGGNPKDLVSYPTISPPLLDLTSPDSTQRVRLAHSHYYLDSARWSAFIIAYYPEPEGLLFFFNPSGFDSVLTFAPNYDYISPSGLSGGEITSVTSGYPTALASHYRGVTVFEFPNSAHNSKQLNAIDMVDATDNKEELRLFHFLRFRNKDRERAEDSTFLAIWVANNPLSATQEALATANFGKDQGFLGNIVDGANLTFEAMGKEYYYIDADTLQLASGEPKDPNELKVEEVFYCQDDYTLVHFSLRFCNISPYPTSAASVFISSQVGDDVSCFKLSDIDAGFTLRDQLDVCDASAIGCGSFDFCTGNATQFNLKYDPIFKDRNTVGYKNCHVLHFTAVATGRGIKAIRDGKALKACVTFRETACELVCSFSEAVSENVVEGTIPQPCPDCLASPPPPPPCWPWIVGAAILVIGLLWYSWRRGFFPFAGKK